MSGLKEDVENNLFKIPHKDLSIYRDGEIYNCDMRVIIQGVVRKDTRSRFQIKENGKIVNLTLRLPPVVDARGKQDQILRMARRHFDERAGCYGRSGNLHVEYPITGVLVNYKLEDFLDDFGGFEDELNQKIDFQDN